MLIPNSLKQIILLNRFLFLLTWHFEKIAIRLLWNRSSQIFSTFGCAFFEVFMIAFDRATSGFCQDRSMKLRQRTKYKEFFVRFTLSFRPLKCKDSNWRELFLRWHPAFFFAHGIFRFDARAWQISSWMLSITTFSTLSLVQFRYACAKSIYKQENSDS